MAQRSELQILLENLLGSRNVYFQPPPSLAMHYPCIVYQRDYMLDYHADDLTYTTHKRYLVMVIAQSPDSAIVDAVKALPLCTYDRFYTAHNLNHDVFKLYF